MKKLLLNPNDLHVLSFEPFPEFEGTDGVQAVTLHWQISCAPVFCPVE